MSTEQNQIVSLDEINKKEQKKNLFDKEFRALVRQCQETINSKYGSVMDFGNTRQELVCLNRYLTIYNSMIPEEHYQYFEMLFGRRRSEILNTLQDRNWLRGTKTIIQFGEGLNAGKDLEQKRKQVKIMLSDIFTIAYGLQETAEQSIEELGREFSDGSKDLIRPSILLLHLMRIFYYLNEGSDKEQLGRIVTQLEDELGVVKKSVAGGEKKSLPFETSGLSGLVSLATGLMEKMGMKAPEGMKVPSEQQISDAVTGIFTNEGTQSAIQGIFSSLGGSDGIGSVIEKFVKGASDPETMQAFTGSIKNVVEAATAATSGTASTATREFHSE